MAEKYIEKSIDTPCGAPALAWDGTLLNADLESGQAEVSLLGYVDEAALVADGDPLLPLDIQIVDIRILASYESVFTELATYLLTQEDSKWYGGSIEPCPIDVHGRLIVKSVVTESGAAASCWRCAKLIARLKENAVELYMFGYLDVDSFCNGKPPVTGKKPIRVSIPMDTLATYPDLYADILADIMVGTALEGGIVKEVGA